MGYYMGDFCNLAYNLYFSQQILGVTIIYNTKALGWEYLMCFLIISFLT